MIAKVLITIVDWLYIAPIRRFIPRDIFGYGLCGGCNLLLDMMWYYLIYHYIVAERFIDLGVVVMSPHIAALMVVFPITFFTGFWLNRNVAFRAYNYTTAKQLFRYALSVVGSLLLNYVLMKLFVEAIHIWPTPSKMLTSIITALYSFLAARYFTFKK